MNLAERVRVGISLLSLIVASYFIISYVDSSPFNSIITDTMPKQQQQKLSNPNPNSNSNSNFPMIIMLSQNMVLTYGKNKFLSPLTREKDERHYMLFDPDKTKRIRPAIEPTSCLSFDVESNTFTWLPCKYAQNDQWEYDHMRQSLKNIQTGAIFDKKTPLSSNFFNRDFIF